MHTCMLHDIINCNYYSNYNKSPHKVCVHLRRTSNTCNPTASVLCQTYHNTVLVTSSKKVACNDQIHTLSIKPLCPAILSCAPSLNMSVSTIPLVITSVHGKSVKDHGEFGSVSSQIHQTMQV